MDTEEDVDQWLQELVSRGAPIALAVQGTLVGWVSLDPLRTLYEILLDYVS